MRKFLNLAVLFVVAVALVACRNNDYVPEDTHEHEEISKVVLKAKNLATNEVQTIEYINGVASGELDLDNNNQGYLVELDFQTKHDDHYHSVNDEIIEEKDEHFIAFDFAGTDLDLTRVPNKDVRSDANVVGLKSKWLVKTNPVNPAKVTIKLFHQPTSVQQNFPSAQQQFGKAEGGDADVEMSITIK